MIYSLAMNVTSVSDGTSMVYQVQAPWLKEPVLAATFEEAYEAAVRARFKQKD